MKDDEKMRTYAQGFKDGWNEAMKQSKMFDHPVMPSTGKSAFSGGYVTERIGAAGSSSINMSTGSMGSNGPTGYGY